ncbi:MAG: hypothetical protein L0Z62_50620 [Gemmataceae bacterium]|nr:hypothetical protein [Gemmataceae bacterium]
MTCCELAEALLDFLEGVLPPDHCDQIRQHLGCCPPCVTFVETYRITITLTRRLPCRPLPPDLEHRLRAALAAGGKDPGS